MGRTWGRLYAGTRNHRKIKILRERFPDHWASWYVLIELAIECDDGGWIYVAPDVPFPIKQLGKEIGIRRKDVCGRFLRALENLKLITIPDGSYPELTQNSPGSGSELTQNSPGSGSELTQNSLGSGSELTQKPQGILLNSFSERNYESDISTPRVQKYREKLKVPQNKETTPKRSRNVPETDQNRTEQNRTDNISIPKGIDCAPTLNNPKNLMEIWNKHAPSYLPRKKALSKALQELIRRRIAEHPETEWWMTLFKDIDLSDFYSGRNGKWTGLDFEWAVKNCEKLRSKLDREKTNMSEEEVDRWKKQFLQN